MWDCRSCLAACMVSCGVKEGLGFRGILQPYAPSSNAPSSSSLPCCLMPLSPHYTHLHGVVLRPQLCGCPANTYPILPIPTPTCMALYCALSSAAVLSTTPTPACPHPHPPAWRCIAPSALQRSYQHLPRPAHTRTHLHGVVLGPQLCCSPVSSITLCPETRPLIAQQLQLHLGHGLVPRQVVHDLLVGLGCLKVQELEEERNKHIKLAALQGGSCV